jgi:hypothetical protein
MACLMEDEGEDDGRLTGWRASRAAGWRRGERTWAGELAAVRPRGSAGGATGATDDARHGDGGRRVVMMVAASGGAKDEQERAMV